MAPSHAPQRTGLKAGLDKRHPARTPSYHQRATQRTRPKASPSVPARPTRVQSLQQNPTQKLQDRERLAQGHTGPCTQAHACMHAAAAGWKHTARGWDHRSAVRAVNQAVPGPPGVLISGRLYRGATLLATTKRRASCTVAHQLHAAAEEDSARQRSPSWPRTPPRATDGRAGHGSAIGTRQVAKTPTKHRGASASGQPSRCLS